MKLESILWGFCLSFISLIAVNTGLAADVTVQVRGALPQSGIIRVIVIAHPDANDARQFASRNVDVSEVQGGVVNVKFLGFAAGDYGFIATTDQSGNHAFWQIFGKDRNNDYSRSSPMVKQNLAAAHVTVPLELP